MTTAPVHADDILGRLGEHWRTLAATGEGELLRACAMTVLVLTEGSPGDAALANSLAELMLAHPFRAVVIGRLEGAGRRLEADVTAQCRLARGRRAQICCEQIEIGATAEALADLPAVALGLIAADLPLVVWLRDADAVELEPLAGLLRLADKLIVDSAAVCDWPATLRRARARLGPGAALADLAWTRLTPWRAALAEALDDPARRDRLGAIERLEVHHSRPAPPASAVYLAAWLRLRLPGCPAATFMPVPADLGLGAVRLYAPGLEIALRRFSADELELACGSELVCRLPAAPKLEDLLAEELSLIGPDPVFEGVLEAALA